MKGIFCQPMSRKKIIAFSLFILCIFVSIVSLRYQIKSGHSYSYCVNDFAYNDNHFRSPGTILDAGQYILNLSVNSSDSIHCVIATSDSTVNDSYVEPNENASYIPFILPKDADNLYIHLYSSDANTTIQSATITSDKWINIDGFYWFALTWLLFIIICCYIIPKNYINFDNHDSLFVLGIMSFTFIYISVLEFEPLVRFGTDTRFHLLRIEGLRDGLKSGQFPVVLYPNAYNGFGEIGALYPNLFLYPAAILRLFGVSLLSAYKTTIYAINIATILVSYFSAKTIVRDRIACSVILLLYTLFPYRLYVMGYSSSALGRGISMCFLPLVFSGLYNILKNHSKDLSNYITYIIMLSVGVSGILNSHLLNFVITVVFILLTCIIFYKQVLYKNTVIALLISAVISCLLSLSFITLLFQYYFSGLNLSYLKFNIYDKLFSPAEALFSPWNTALILYILITILVHKYYKQKLPTYVLYFIIISFLFSFMATSLFPWKILLANPILNSAISTLQNSKRLYFLTSLCSSFLAGLCIAIAKSKKHKYLLSILFISISIICTIKPYKEHFSCDPLLDSATGFLEKEQLEYLPDGATPQDFQSNVASVSDESAINVISYTKQGADVYFEYTCSKDNVYADLPMFYYNGGQFAEGSNGKANIYMGPKHNVRVILEKTDIPSYIRIGFRVPKIHYISGLVNMIFIILLLIFITAYYRNWFAKTEK